MFKNKGFTLIELLVVIAIIGLLSSLAIVSLSAVRKKSRDAKRLADMRQIRTALELYYGRNGRYPSISADSCCDGWDQGPCGSDAFIGALVSAGLMSKVPTDPLGCSGTSCCGYSYYRYSPGAYGCPAARGYFFVLGVRDMETSSNPHPSSPGWKCTNRNWQSEFDWVVGGFEN